MSSDLPRHQTEVQFSLRGTAQKPSQAALGQCADVCGLIIDCLGPLIKCAEMMHHTIREGLHGEKTSRAPKADRLRVYFLFSQLI